jgi:hypothetical protein
MLRGLFATPAVFGRNLRARRGGVGSPANPTFGTPSYVAPARQVPFSARLNF